MVRRVRHHLPSSAAAELEQVLEAIRGRSREAEREGGAGPLELDPSGPLELVQERDACQPALADRELDSLLQYDRSSLSAYGHGRRRIRSRIHARLWRAFAQLGWSDSEPAVRNPRRRCQPTTSRPSSAANFAVCAGCRIPPRYPCVR